MNDLDLRMALHRDADLVGEPSPDLLDQLALRRGKQRRQRAGMLAAALGVVVIAAGIPVGSSLLTQSDPGPAVEITTPAPSTTQEVPTTPSATTEVPPPVTSAPPAPETEAPVPTEPVVSGPSECPDQATLLPILSAAKDVPPLRSVSDRTYCSGAWAFTPFNFDNGVDEYGVTIPWMYPGLFRWVDGTWTHVDRNGPCNAGKIPDDIWDLVCNSS
jgi:hypothetical protein